ncbi:hypothetical protein COU20_01125 [Candidatus Kaiserbacteria bacterium CG10_big_fil_rev_8_21_14_0_10_59_10]|uniref:Uncharacterized protein n=1 Tax=Candidatus Kaiserbacteria bacterium CG10_big_fil_rev_8_21_14_0_10_59_10 TaxID=1974612 RepID=A0A2H0UAG3_9BACT|nr:MAG: hypothetical protein COU20_01125 [Candidatus Kaiserbacteria bacterium CG10_big_fil_rev_8_21_14_0_10_59_10]
MVTIVVGRGGSGGSAPNDVDSDAGYFYNGGAGAHGRVVIEWTADACPTPLETVAGGLGFRLAAGIADRKLNKHGTNACVSNSGTLTYFIPARTSAELQSFMNAISRLFGVQAN